MDANLWNLEDVKEERVTMLEIMFVITAICYLLICTAVYSASREIRRNFTDEQWKVIESKNRSTRAWYITVLFIICPVINIFVAIGIGFRYGDIIDSLVGKYKDYLT